MRDIAARVQEGLPVIALTNVSEWYGVPVARLAAVLGIPSRTLARRMKQDLLTPAESDRLARLARVFAHASVVFGSTDAAGRWMMKPHWLFKGQAPLDCQPMPARPRSINWRPHRAHPF
jgi:putative toxin-antitoxin system antitoxin component (TIGR02293 family)